MSWLDPFLYGKNAFSLLVFGFTQPATNGTITVTLDGTAWMVVGQPVFVTGGGVYTVASIVDVTHAVLTNTGATGNASPGDAVHPGRGVSPCGVTGAGGGGGGGLSGIGYGYYFGVGETPTHPGYGNWVSTNVPPACTVTVGASGVLLVHLAWQMTRSAIGFTVFGSVEMSGANTKAAADNWSVQQSQTLGTGSESPSGMLVFTGLNPGSTVVTSQYRSDVSSGGDFSISRASIMVIPV